MTELERAWDDLVRALPRAAEPRLHTLLEGGGVLAAADARALAGLLATTVDDLMVRLLPLAAGFAVVPISGFRVGAVAQAGPAPGEQEGALYLGANLEFAGQALSFGVHAEQAAVSNAWLHGESRVVSLAVSAPPCGYCRQFLWELAEAAAIRILLPGREGVGHRAEPLPEFLPHPFGPANLGVPGGLMAPDPGGRLLTLEGGARDPLVELALEAARRSYAPYTRGRAGCAVEADDGSTFPGRYAENAAYNPSLSPMAAAVSFMSLHRPGGRIRAVRRAVLVEVGSAQRLASEAVAGVPVEQYRARAGA